MITVKFAGKVAIGSCLTIAFSLTSAAAPVGTLSRIDGVAIVSKGAQYVRGQEGMALTEGDRIMAMEDGSAIISFADGCEYALTDSEFLTVGSISTCASAAGGSSYKVDPHSGVSQGVGTYHQAALGSNDDDSADLSIPYEVSAGGSSGAGATVGGGAGGATVGGVAGAATIGGVTVTSSMIVLGAAGFLAVAGATLETTGDLEQGISP